MREKSDGVGCIVLLLTHQGWKKKRFSAIQHNHKVFLHRYMNPGCSSVYGIRWWSVCAVRVLCFNAGAFFLILSMFLCCANCQCVKKELWTGSAFILVCFRLLSLLQLGLSSEVASSCAVCVLWSGCVLLAWWRSSSKRQQRLQAKPSPGQRTFFPLTDKVYSGK